MDQFYTLGDFLDLVRRRARIIVLIIVVGCIVSLVYALSQRHLYESSEVIQVTQPSVSRGDADSASDASIARRLQLVEQQLMTRNTVLEIAGKYGVFDDMPDLSETEKVVRMRESISIAGVPAPSDRAREDGVISVLTITATFGTPELAQQIASEFSRRTIELSTDSRMTRARETLEFFQAEEERLTAEINAIEDKIAAYRRENDLARPGELDMRREQVAAINAALLEIERETLRLERQLSDLDRGQRAATLERQTREIELQLNALADQKALLETRLEGLNQAIGSTPEVESELGILERRRENMQTELDVVSVRVAEAELSFKLESERRSETLTVIEEAPLPENPVSGSRKKLALMGGMASVAFAFVVAFLLDMYRPVIRTAAQMERRLGITPVVTIPPVDTRASFKKQARRKRSGTPAER